MGGRQSRPSFAIASYSSAEAPRTVFLLLNGQPRIVRALPIAWGTRGGAVSADPGRSQCSALVV